MLQDQKVHLLGFHPPTSQLLGGRSNGFEQELWLLYALWTKDVTNSHTLGL